MYTYFSHVCLNYTPPECSGISSCFHMPPVILFKIFESGLSLLRVVVLEEVDCFGNDHIRRHILYRHIYMHMYTYLERDVYTCIYIHTHIYIWNICVYKHIHLYICMYVYVFEYLQMYIDDMYVRTHTLYIHFFSHNMQPTEVDCLWLSSYNTTCCTTDMYGCCTCACIMHTPFPSCPGLMNRVCIYIHADMTYVHTYLYIYIQIYIDVRMTYIYVQTYTCIYSVHAHTLSLSSFHL